MSLFRFSLLAACLLVLGFDLACDGSRRTRLRRAIEQQKDDLQRGRQQLSILRSDYDAALLRITWKQLEKPMIEAMPEPIFSWESSSDPSLGLVEVSLSLAEHLNVEKEKRD